MQKSINSDSSSAWLFVLSLYIDKYVGMFGAE